MDISAMPFFSPCRTNSVQILQSQQNHSIGQVQTPPHQRPPWASKVKAMSFRPSEGRWRGRGVCRMSQENWESPVSPQSQASHKAAKEKAERTWNTLIMEARMEERRNRETSYLLLASAKGESKPANWLYPWHVLSPLSNTLFLPKAPEMPTMVPADRTFPPASGYAGLLFPHFSPIRLLYCQAVSCFLSSVCPVLSFHDSSSGPMHQFTSLCGPN